LSNSIVLDPFGGSGSTLIACEQTGRICYTIELDEKYADVIVEGSGSLRGPMMRFSCCVMAIKYAMKKLEKITNKS